MRLVIAKIFVRHLHTFFERLVKINGSSNCLSGKKQSNKLVSGPRNPSHLLNNLLVSVRG